MRILLPYYSCKVSPLYWKSYSHYGHKTFQVGQSFTYISLPIICMLTAGFYLHIFRLQATCSFPICAMKHYTSQNSYMSYLYNFCTICAKVYNFCTCTNCSIFVQYYFLYNLSATKFAKARLVNIFLLSLSN